MSDFILRLLDLTRYDRCQEARTEPGPTAKGNIPMAASRRRQPRTWPWVLITVTALITTAGGGWQTWAGLAVLAALGGLAARTRNGWQGRAGWILLTAAAGLAVCAGGWETWAGWAGLAVLGLLAARSARRARALIGTGRNAVRQLAGRSS